MGRLAAADGGKRQVQAVEQGIITVEDGHAVRLEVLEDLTLRLQDTLPAAQKFDVGVANVGDDGNIRPDHLAQVGDLPEVVHAGLDDCRLMLRPQLQKRQGRTDVVVEVLRGLEDPVLGSQHRGDHFLGGGLAYTARDLDEGDPEPVPVIRRQRLERQARIVHLDVELVRPQICRQLSAQASGGAGGEGRVNKIVTVEPFPLPGDEQTAGLHAPAVGTDRAHRLRSLPGVPPHAVHSLGDFLHSHGLHINILSSFCDRTAARSPRTALHS